MKGIAQLVAVIGSIGCLIVMVGIAGGVEYGSIDVVVGAILAAVAGLTEAAIFAAAFSEERADEEGDHE